MIVFDKMEHGNFEQVLYCQDEPTGLKAMVVIHSSVLGPAVGGCRMWTYENERAALLDALNLAKGMTYKASCAGLNWGGAKAVIMAPKDGFSSPAAKAQLLRRYAAFVDRLNGHYITAKDVGISAEDLSVMRSVTPFVLGIEGEAGSIGDPSPWTATGVYEGMLAAAGLRWGSASLKGKRIVLQGLGCVSRGLLPFLLKEGAEVIGCDISPERAEFMQKTFGIGLCSPEEVYSVECDIFSPNALGGVLNAKTVKQLKAAVIAGGANNQLETPEMGEWLHAAGITYVPDYVLNAGGLISIYYDRADQGLVDKAQALKHVQSIGQTVRRVLERSKSTDTPSFLIADQMAEERIHAKGVAPLLKVTPPLEAPIRVAQGGL
jgi:leucine dehydrogenase